MALTCPYCHERPLKIRWALTCGVRECKNKRKKAYYQDHRDILIEKAKAYYRANKPEINKRNLEYKRARRAKIALEKKKNKEDKKPYKESIDNKTNALYEAFKDKVKIKNV